MGNKKRPASQAEHDWVRGAGGVRAIPRVEKLARLYQQLDEADRQPNTRRETYLELATKFAELKAHCHVSICMERAG